MASTSPKLLRIDEVLSIVGMKKGSLYRLARLGTFPSAIKLSARSSAWVEAEVLVWVTSRIAIRDTRLAKQGVA
jgi:prophage regulatory protein